MTLLALPRSLAGDFGFDPLGLGKDATSLRWYQQAELVHARTAMTAVAGILIPGVRGSGAQASARSHAAAALQAPPVAYWHLRWALSA